MMALKNGDNVSIKQEKVIARTRTWLFKDSVNLILCE